MAIKTVSISNNSGISNSSSISNTSSISYVNSTGSISSRVHFQIPHGTLEYALSNISQFRDGELYFDIDSKRAFVAYGYKFYDLLTGKKIEKPEDAKINLSLYLGEAGDYFG